MTTRRILVGWLALAATAFGLGGEAQARSSALLPGPPLIERVALPAPPPPVPEAGPFDPDPRIIEPALGFHGQEYFHSLDLDRAARDQYGPDAFAVAIGDTIEDWRADVGGAHEEIDLQLAVDEQYGTQYSLVALGTHRDDWRALHIPVNQAVVLPVLLVSADMIGNVADVDRALDDYGSLVYRTQILYWERVGATFRLIEPVVLPSGTRAFAWHLAEDVAEFVDPAGRFVMLYQAAEEYTDHDAPPSGAVIAAISPYTGLQPLRSEGAGSTGKFAVVPPRANSVTCPLAGAANATEEGYCHNSVYALGHELGHVFGLKHSCDQYPDDPDAPYSVMQFDTPTHILLGPEVHILRNSPYFTIDSGGAPSIPAPPPGWTCPE